ncbi:MAG: hypothetical protein AB1757_02685 [Acidobacteriota bacterium]
MLTEAFPEKGSNWWFFPGNFQEITWHEFSNSNPPEHFDQLAFKSDEQRLSPPEVVNEDENDEKISHYNADRFIGVVPNR